MDSTRRTFFGCFVLIAAIAICGGTMFFTFDRICVSYLPQRLPFYPNAEVTFRRHNFVTPWGVGSTVVILESPDPPDTVRAWYGRQIGGFLREIAETDDLILFMGQRLARAEWLVERHEEGGSWITLYGTCVN